MGIVPVSETIVYRGGSAELIRRCVLAPRGSGERGRLKLRQRFPQTINGKQHKSTDIIETPGQSYGKVLLRDAAILLRVGVGVLDHGRVGFATLCNSICGGQGDRSCCSLQYRQWCPDSMRETSFYHSKLVTNDLDGKQYCKQAKITIEGRTATISFSS